MHKFILKAGVLALTLAGMFSASQIIDVSSVDHSGSATFTFGAGTLQIVLNNTTTAGDAKDVMTYLTFNLSSGTPTLSTQTGQMMNVTGTGAVNFPGGNPTWGFGSTGGHFLLCEICTGSVTPGSGAGPQQGIIGPGSGPAATPYSTANGSITNGSHSPFVNGTATFTFTAPGVTADTVARNVVFGWNTTYGSVETPGTPGGTGGGTETPEPGSMFLLGGGLLALGFGARKRLATK